MPDPTRIAVIISGGVSLGTYEAGAVTELLMATALAHTSGRPFGFDLFVGASAGSLTSALCAYTMLYGWDDTDRLRRAWVEDISFERLYGTEEDRAVRSSLLSGRVIEELAQKYLSSPIQITSHPAAVTPMSVAFSLTNLNGVRYDDVFPLARRPELTVPYPTEITFFADNAVYTIPPGPFDGRLWAQIRSAAIASGAFPLAFPPHVVARTEDTLLNPPPLGHPPISLPHDFTYSDGGILNNEPLGLARDIVARRGTDGDRWYVLIDPYYSDAGVEDRTLTPDNVTLPSTVKRLVTILTKSASAADWLTVQKVNNYLEWYEQLRGLLLPLIRASSLPAGFPDQVASVAANLAKRKWSQDGAARREGENRRLDAFLAGQAPWYGALPPGDPKRQATRDLFFVLENAAGFRGKAAMRVAVIAPERPGSLAGDFLANFGGFFRRDWRQHDYTCGAVDAKNVLQMTIFSDRPYPDTGTPSAHPPHPDYRYDDIDASQRERFEGLLTDQLDRVLKEMNVGWLGRKLAACFLARKLVGILEKV